MMCKRKAGPLSVAPPPPPPPPSSVAFIVFFKHITSSILLFQNAPYHLALQSSVKNVRELKRSADASSLEQLAEEAKWARVPLCPDAHHAHHSVFVAISSHTLDHLSYSIKYCVSGVNYIY